MDTHESLGKKKDSKNEYYVNTLLMFILLRYFRQTDNLKITCLKEGQTLKFSFTKVQFPNEFGGLIFQVFSLTIGHIY